ncbi:MAG TPA: RluA family pseudouridine synthase [Chthoniobacterales bacterium]|nr:RluA family pseudouridine synthase [Chthoniobacterales bacterium]
MMKLEVAREHSGLRLDRFLALALPNFSRARLQTLIRDGFVRLNEKTPRPRDAVRTGDTVELTEPAIEKVEALPEQIALEILFEDDDLLVLNKPAGLVMHPGAGHQQHTLVNALLAHCKNLSGIGGKERPGIVHRLDKETSGCLVVAKNDATHRDLSRQFAARTMTKIYLALVAGTLRKRTGVIDKAIARHPVHRQRMSIARRQGRSAKTEYRVLRSGISSEGGASARPAGISLLECTLHSGRTHQIRVHLHDLGHPVLGDKLYGGKRAGDFPRQMLHAWKLAFCHPRSGEEMSFEAPLPPDFAEAMGQIPTG